MIYIKRCCQNNLRITPKNMHLVRSDLHNTIQFHEFQHDNAKKISYQELTSCNVHTVNRKCRRVQIPMSFGPSFCPALLQNTTFQSYIANSHGIMPTHN